MTRSALGKGFINLISTQISKRQRGDLTPEHLETTGKSRGMFSSELSVCYVVNEMNAR